MATRLIEALRDIARQLPPGLDVPDIPRHDWYEFPLGFGLPAVRQAFGHWLPFSLGQRPDFMSPAGQTIFWGKLRELVKSIPPINEAVRVIEPHPYLVERLKFWEPVSDRHEAILVRLINPFLCLYLAGAENSRFDAERFDWAADQVVQEAVPHAARLIAPLSNLVLGAGALDFGDGLVLRPVTKPEMERWFNSENLLLDGFRRRLELRNVQSVIEQSAPPSEWWDSQTLSASALANAITAIRLLKNSGTHDIFIEEQSLGLIWQGFRQTLRWPGIRPIDATVTLGPDEYDPLRLLYSRVRGADGAQVENRNRVALALKRWDAAWHRLDDEDKLVDYWIGLESVFTTGSSQEIKFRASLRVAAFLGKTAKERIDIRHRVAGSYDWRSLIVHGGKEKRRAKLTKSVGSLNETTLSTRRSLALSLQRILEMNTAFDPDEIDDSLMRASAAQFERDPHDC